MTYYECISLLREITNNQQNEELLTKLNNANINFYNDAKYRFAIHVINTVKTRENKAFDKFLTIITEELINFGAFSLEVLNLKKELIYIEKIVKNKLIPNECRQDIIGVYENIINSYNNFIEEILNNYYQDNYLTEYQTILNRKEGSNELSKN